MTHKKTGVHGREIFQIKIIIEVNLYSVVVFIWNDSSLWTPFLLRQIQIQLSSKILTPNDHQIKCLGKEVEDIRTSYLFAIAKAWEVSTF